MTSTPSPRRKNGPKSVGLSTRPMWPSQLGLRHTDHRRDCPATRECRSEIECCPQRAVDSFREHDTLVRRSTELASLLGLRLLDSHAEQHVVVILTVVEPSSPGPAFLSEAPRPQAGASTRAVAAWGWFLRFDDTECSAVSLQQSLHRLLSGRSSPLARSVRPTTLASRLDTRERSC